MPQIPRDKSLKGRLALAIDVYRFIAKRLIAKRLIAKRRERYRSSF